MKQVNLKICRIALLLLIGLFSSLGSYAQEVTVRGHVKDVSGEPVIGANVIVKGTTIGTITDFDGNFVLNAPQNSTLEITFIGYKPVEVVTARSITITMEDDAILLDEAVIIGYGVVKKSDATGSVMAIKPDEMSKGITTSAQDMMMGKLAGVSVVNNGGTPGGGATIRIRGGSSLSASNDPLIVIDGLALDNDGIKGMSNGLAMINPNDIETMTVLKDASSTAIYGSRASNGVIIITTKKGQTGSKAKIAYNGNFSLGTIASKLDVMDGNEYKEYITNLYGAGNLPFPLGTANTDWQSEIYRTAVNTEHNITVSGGLKNMPYRVSLGYTGQQGIVKTSKFDRYTVSLNLSPSLLNDHLKFNINAKAMYGKNRYADGGAIGSAAVMDPTRGVKEPGMEVFGGYYQWGVASSYKNPDWLLTPNSLAPQNPVALLELKNDNAKSSNFVGNIEVDYKFHFLPDLRVHANLGGDYSEGRQTTINSPYSYGNHYYGWDGASEEWKYNISGNAYLQYVKELGVHSLDVMVGAEQQHFHRTWHNWGQGVNPLTQEAYNKNDVRGGRHSSLVSYFGRLNYNLLNRYLLTATIRRDGSSRFSSDNQWGMFPSAALGWKIKEEAFLRDVDVLSELKLRLGWGITGQQNITGGDFPYLPQYVSNIIGGYYQFGDEFVSTSRPNEYNNDLKWEETTTYNVGLDFGFMNNRITGSVDYYFRETKDLLNTVRIPAGTNFNTMLIQNIGTLENEGLEITVSGKPVVTKDFMWQLDYNIAYNKNKITKLTASDSDDFYVATGGISHGTGSTIQAHKVGYAANSFYVYQQVYDANKKPIENLYVDRNGDGIINDADRYIYKKPAGDVLMGLTSKMIWKKWDFSFALRASFNNYVYNDVLADRADVSANAMWATSGFYTNRPLDAVKLGFQGVGDYYMSDYFVQNASFLRCDNITLGYSFNLFKSGTYKGIEGRANFTVQNPFVITKYEGLDPEISRGIDNNIYPRPRTFLLGLSLQF